MYINNDILALLLDEEYEEDFIFSHLKSKNNQLSEQMICSNLAKLKVFTKSLLIDI